MRTRSTIVLFCLAAAVWGRDASGFGIGEVMQAKSIPDATVSIIDPESGTSSGTEGSDVRLADGDIILFRFAWTPVPDKSNRSMASYLTEYLPPGTELVGVRYIDENGWTIEPNWPGLAVDGCTGGSKCNSFVNLPCNNGADNCTFATGSVSQVHADTGVFYTVDARVAKNPADAFLAVNGPGGISMTSEPARLGDIEAPLDVSPPYYAHNAWDWLQVRAFGINGSTSGSEDGNTPFGYGSPVAGPETFYPYEATDNGAFGIELNDVPGPWRRVVYPGSKIGFGDPSMGTSGLTRRNIRDPIGAEEGWDLTPATPRSATAVRFAAGEARTGQVTYVEVALRVVGDPPIDPLFAGTGGNVNCGEITGSGLSARTSGFLGGQQPQTGSETAWAYYLGSPGCVFLRLKFDLKGDKKLAPLSRVTYTINGTNLSVDDETGVVVRKMWDNAKLKYVAGSASPPADSDTPTTCPAPDTDKTCLFWTLGTLAPSDDYVISASFDTQGGGHISAVMEGVYTSNELPGGEFRTRDVTILVPLAQPDIALAPFDDPLTTPATAGSPATIWGTVRNDGTNSFSWEGIILMLPTGFTGGANITVGGTNYACVSGCAGNTPAYAYSSSMAAGTLAPISATVNVPGGTPDGLYDIDVAIWGSQTGGGFGGSFETTYPKLVTLPVGLPRTAPPVLDCPIGSTAPSVTGDSEPNADISLRFNLLERGDGTADGAGQWAVNNYGAFGGMYGGLEVRATATAPMKLESELSEPCFVTQAYECSDGIDNDGDGLADFPADPGCESPTDKDETDPPTPECSDGINNDGANGTDYPADPSCYGPDDPTEDGVVECNDLVDNDGDGFTDFPADTSCASATGRSETNYNDCQDLVNNDGDGATDFPADPGCHSAFDDSEVNVSYPAGEIKARILIVFDTSGSMNMVIGSDAFSGGDGSDECAGMGGSRMVEVKSGISNVVTGFGEVEYGLMRFYQRPEPFACPSVNASLRSGGWQGGGAEPCAGGFDAGEVIVSFAPDNANTLLDWMDGSSNYPGGVPPAGMDFELRGSGTTPIAGALTSALTYLQGVQAADTAVDCRPYRVILVTDGLETCGGNPTAAAAALEAAGIPVHVIGFADPALKPNLDLIAAAGGTDEAIVATDAASLSAEMSAIVTETILVEYCNGVDDDCDDLIDEGFNVGELCDNGEDGVCLVPGEYVCTLDGLGTQCDAGPGTPLCPDTNPECECNGLDDDCDGEIDEGHGASCVCIPIPEVCNGADDDCDGVADNLPIAGIGDDCGLDIGECTFGTLVCSGGMISCTGGTGPVAETCNGLDDDCDTEIDELAEVCYELGTGTECNVMTGVCVGRCQTGIRTCAPGGGFGECVGDVGPIAELCNGEDDDCDGEVDEDFNAGDACDNMQMGLCLVIGTYECTADGSGTYCTATPVPPGTEVCNSLDDDCDGETDEDLGPPIGNPCGEGTGCTGGTLQCVDGEVECVGGTGGTAETCNALDDDCDSVIDESPLPGEGEDCYTFPIGCEVGVGCMGECELGATVCIAGGFVCVDDVGPKPETCNGVDDNCDGIVDNEAMCPSPTDICLEGSCVFPCIGGEFPCPLDFICRDIPGEGLFCVPDPCVGVTCPDGELCDQADGSCYDPCDTITCPTGAVCEGGNCFDCFDAGFECPEGERCVPDMIGVGTCQEDLCFGVTCGELELCVDGECVPFACSPPCPDGQRCDEGACVADPCFDVECLEGQVCRDGSCIADLCEGINCPDNFVCHPNTGQCIPDPCGALMCPEGMECVLDFDGDATCQVPPPPPPPPDNSIEVYAAGGGCSCATSDRGAPGAGAWLLLGVVALGLRRRRSSS